MENKNIVAKRGKTAARTTDWQKLDMRTKLQFCTNLMTASAILDQNGFVQLAMRIDEHDAYYIDNQAVDCDTYYEAWALTKGLRILTLEFDKWETHDPNRPRIDLTCIAIQDLLEFRKRLKELR